MTPGYWFKLRHDLYDPCILTTFSAQRISALSTPTDVSTNVNKNDLLVTDVSGVFLCKVLGLDGSSSVEG